MKEIKKTVLTQTLHCKMLKLIHKINKIFCQQQATNLTLLGKLLRTYFVIIQKLTIIPQNLVTNWLLSFLKPKTSIRSSVSWWSGNKKCFFCLQQVVLYFKAMPNSIDFYKGIFLHVLFLFVLQFHATNMQMWCCNSTEDMLKQKNH